MNIDFHTHILLTKQVSFSIEHFLDYVSQAKAAGLTAMTITEHADAIHYSEVFRTLDATFPYSGDYYDIEGFKIFPGMEVQIREGGHILLTANRAVLREIKAELDPFQTGGQFIPFPRLSDLTENRPVLKIGAHPFRPDNSLFQMSGGCLSKFDAFDLNGKDLAHFGTEPLKEKTGALARRFNTPVVTGSDTHHPLQIGCVYNSFAKDCRTVEELREEIHAGNFRLFLSPRLQEKVQAAATVKKSLKEMLRSIGKIK